MVPWGRGRVLEVLVYPTSMVCQKSMYQVYMKKFTLYFLIAIVVTSLVALYKTTQHKKELFQLQAVTGPQMLCAI